MEPVVSPGQMAAADQRTLATGLAPDALIERAAAALAARVRRVLGGTYGRRAVVVCGKGNNGNDGRVLVRILRGWGVGVDEFALADGIDRARLERALARCHIAVDAMFGTGFRGVLEGDAAWVAERFGEAPLVLAVDIPSGVNGADGSVAGPAVRAHHTVCFAARKTGLLLTPGRFLAGTLHVVDIGVEVLDGDLSAWCWGEADARRHVWHRDPGAHKWSNAVLVIAGSRGMTGAAALAARAAQRAGSGMVVAAVPGSAAAERLSGAEIVVRALSAAPDGALDRAAGREVLELAARFRAVVLGPGLGGSSDTRAVVREVVEALECPLVLDADGLNALDGDLAPLQRRRAPTVLTPHDAEYGRLVGARPGADRLSATRRLADAAGAVVLLKGPTTVVAAPGALPLLVADAGSELATAGTGDVLSGIVAAALAHAHHAGADSGAGGDADGPAGSAGEEMAHTVASAAWVHAAAAASVGKGSGTIAGEVADAVASTLRRIAAPGPVREPLP